MADEPSLLDTLMDLGGTRNPTGGVDMPMSLIDLLAKSHPDVYQQIMASMAPSRRPPSPNLYWDARHPQEGGTNEIIQALTAPSAGHYRIVPSIEDAKGALDSGESPLVYGSGLHDLDPRRLPQLQQEQYAAPGGEPWFLPGPDGLTLNTKMFPQ